MPSINESSLEQVFSDISYSHLRDKSQGLLDYLVGFQMLKQEEDGERAVGIFGFEIDGDFYYAPVFFLNGEVRGLDSLYSVKSDLFMPLTDGWVNAIIDRRQIRLGDPDRRSRTERGVRVPNYNRLKIIPGGGGGVNLKLANAMMGPREDTLTVSLTDELSDAGVAGLFKQALDNNVRLRDAFESFGYNYYDLVDRTAAPTQKVAAEEPVTIISQITDEGVDSLTDEQRRQILDGGTVVIDSRPEVAKSQVFVSETNDVLENPTKGGLYDVVYSDGKVEPTLVAPNGSTGGTSFVYCPARDDAYAEIDNSCIYAVRRYTDQEFRDWLDENSSPVEDCRPGDVAAFVSQEGESTSPFCIDQANTGVDDILVYRIRDKHYAAVCGYNYRPRGDNGNPMTNLFDDARWAGAGRQVDPNYRVKQILVTERGAESPRYFKDRVVINKRHFRAVKINRFREESADGTDLVDNEVYTNRRVDRLLRSSDFGDYNTIYAAMDKVASDLRVWSDGRETHVKVAGDVHSFRSEGDGLKLLIGGFGIGESDARAMVKSASIPTTYKFRPVTKIAAQLLSLPEIEDTDLSGYMSSFHQQQVPFQTTTRATSENNRDFYRYESPFASGGEEAANTFDVLEDAGKTGQKDVFDAAALASLIKSHNPTDLVDRFLPTITSGMDRIGRMLFLIYWHYEDFEERYGENDLSEFIDNLKAVFEQMGDIVIFSKRKTLAGDPEHYGMNMSPLMDGDE